MPGLSPLATLSSEYLGFGHFRPNVNSQGFMGRLRARSGAVPKAPTGFKLTPSFHGDNGNARKNQGRANLEATMLHFLWLGGSSLGKATCSPWLPGNKAHHPSAQPLMHWCMARV